MWLKPEGELSFELQEENKGIAVRLGDSVDAIPTQVHGVVMAIMGFPVQHSEYSTYQSMSSAPPQVIPKKVLSHSHMQKAHFNMRTILVSLHRRDAANN